MPPLHRPCTGAMQHLSSRVSCQPAAVWEALAAAVQLGVDICAYNTGGNVGIPSPRHLADFRKLTCTYRFEADQEEARRRRWGFGSQQMPHQFSGGQGAGGRRWACAHCTM